MSQQTPSLKSDLPATTTKRGLFTDQMLHDASGHTPVEQRARAAAARIGLEASEVEHLPFDLSVLETEGIFINVDARGFGILDRRLDWSTLGIELPRESAVAFHPPRIGILPNQYRLPLQRPQSQAHTALHKYSYHFRLTETMFESPAFRWVPWQAFPQFEADFNAALQSLNQAKATALEHYEEIIEGVTATFTRLADDSARRLQATTGVPVPVDFRSRIIEGALALVPSREDLQHKLSLRFTPGVILLGSEMIAEQRRAAEERLRLVQTEAETDAVQAESRRRQRLEQMDMLAEEERRRQQSQFQQEELERERETKERIRRLKVEAARQRIEESLSPLTEGMNQLHAKLYEAAQAMRETLTGAKFVPGATAARARELARWFKLMNFQNDEGLQKLLDELNSLASERKETRSPEAIRDVLKDIARATQKGARQVRERHRFDALEV